MDAAPDGSPKSGQRFPQPQDSRDDHVWSRPQLLPHEGFGCDQYEQRMPASVEDELDYDNVEQDAEAREEHEGGIEGEEEDSEDINKADSVEENSDEEEVDSSNRGFNISIQGFNIPTKTATRNIPSFEQLDSNTLRGAPWDENDSRLLLAALARSGCSDTATMVAVGQRLGRTAGSCQSRWKKIVCVPSASKSSPGYCPQP